MRILYLLVILVFASCVSKKVYVDYDESLDYSQYDSYDFYIEDSGMSQLDENRIISSIDSVLTSKDIDRKTIPKFSINFYAEFYMVETENNIGLSVGSGNETVGGSASSNIPLRTQKEMVALTIEFVDALTKELFWQGVMERKLKTFKHPSERDLFISEIVSTILAEYPPERQ